MVRVCSRILLVVVSLVSTTVLCLEQDIDHGVTTNNDNHTDHGIDTIVMSNNSTTNNVTVERDLDHKCPDCPMGCSIYTQSQVERSCGSSYYALGSYADSWYGCVRGCCEMWATDCCKSSPVIQPTRPIIQPTWPVYEPVSPRISPTRPITQPSPRKTAPTYIRPEPVPQPRFSPFRPLRRPVLRTTPRLPSPTRPTRPTSCKTCSKELWTSSRVNARRKKSGTCAAKCSPDSYWWDNYSFQGKCYYLCCAWYSTTCCL